MRTKNSATLRFAAVLLSIFAFAAPASAYLEELHRRMTNTAYLQTGYADFLLRLGASPSEFTALREACKQGAVDEDSVPRPLNHFFDPEHQQELTVPVPTTNGSPEMVCIPVGQTAADWSENGAWNVWDLNDAHQWHYAALVGSTEAERRFARQQLFLTLGHMMHLVQDMAQPEHTRNDQHLNYNGYSFFAGNATAASLYEHWTGSNLIPLTLQDGTPNDSFFAYPTVNLQSYRDYFDGPLGLATYSNRSYVTQDTNYSDSPICLTHLLPRLTSAIPQTIRVREHVRLPNGNVTDVDVDHDVYTSFPVDSYTGANERDAYHTVRSALDFETKIYDPGHPVFTLNSNSYLTRAANLIPKAVGYSAGLLNRYFRGKISVVWHRNADATYRAEITNLSPDTLRDASFSILVRDPRQPNGLAGYLRVGEIPVLAPGGKWYVHDLASPDPTRALEAYERRTVLRGTLGNESNAVLGLVQAADVVLKVVLTNSGGMAYWDSTIWIPTGLGSAYQSNRWNMKILNFMHEDFTPDTTATLTNLPTSGEGSVTFTIVTQPNKTFILDWALDPWEGTFPRTATVAVYHDDRLVGTLSGTWTWRLRQRIQISPSIDYRCNNGAAYSCMYAIDDVPVP